MSILIENCHDVRLVDCAVSIDVEHSQNIKIRRSCFDKLSYAARIGPNSTVEVEDCRGYEIKGHAFLKHPTSKLSIKNSNFEDRNSYRTTAKNVAVFRDRYGIPDTVTDEEIVSLSRLLRTRETRSQKKTTIRKSRVWKHIKRSFRRQKLIDWLMLCAMLVAISEESWIFRDTDTSDRQRNPQDEASANMQVPIPVPRPTRE